MLQTHGSFSLGYQQNLSPTENLPLVFIWYQLMLRESFQIIPSIILRLPSTRLFGTSRQNLLSGYAARHRRHWHGNLGGGAGGGGCREGSDHHQGRERQGDLRKAKAFHV